MFRTGLLVLVAALAIGAKCNIGPPATELAYDPYASVDWERDVRCKTQFHDHIDVLAGRLQAYDDAGYCAVSFLQYSGVPGQTSSWKELHWPPEQWFTPAVLASLRSIQLLIPDVEQGGWSHATSPFLTTYLECYQDASSRYPNPRCAQAPAPKQAYDYSNEAQLVNLIHQFGGLVSLAHPIDPRPNPPVDSLPVDAMEICSAKVEYDDWQCHNTPTCSGGVDGPANMLANYDRKLASRPRTWAICVNDWHGPFGSFDPVGPAWIPDSGYQIVLAPQIDLPTMKERYRQGAMLAVQDRGVPKGHVPVVSRISTSAYAIVIEATDYQRIDWIQGGQVVASSAFVQLKKLAPGSIRAEIYGLDGSVVFTQPWELR
jgi:hypothetical protein